MALKAGERLAELTREWRAARARHPRIVAAVTAAFLLVATISIVGGVWFLNGLRDGLPEYGALRRMGEMDQATAVFDDHDQIAFTIFKEQRMEVPLSEISPHLVKAVIATEDQRFYDHRGFDLVRIGSAAFANVRHRRASHRSPVEPGSR